MTPAVSVVIAAYENPEYLPWTVESVLAQTRTDFEVIISDDSKSNRIQQCVRRWSDSRIIYRRNSTTLGPAGNHRHAFRAARGRFISILNHDDGWEPDFLATVVRPIEQHSHVVVSFCDHWVIDSQGNLLTNETELNTQHWGRLTLPSGPCQPFHRLAVGQSIPLAMGAVFRRDALSFDDPPDQSDAAYDLWINFRLAATSGAAWYTPQRLTSWRVHPASLTLNRNVGWALGAAHCWQSISGVDGWTNFSSLIQQRIHESFYSAARTQLCGGRRSETRRFALAAIRAGSGQFRPLALWLASFLPSRLLSPFIQ